jgi:hypothetical protein
MINTEGSQQPHQAPHCVAGALTDLSDLSDLNDGVRDILEDDCGELIRLFPRYSDPSILPIL